MESHKGRAYDMSGNSLAWWWERKQFEKRIAELEQKLAEATERPHG